MKKIKYFILFLFIFMFGMVNVGANAILVKPSKLQVKGATNSTNNTFTNYKTNTDKWVKLYRAVYDNGTYYDLVIMPVNNYTNRDQSPGPSWSAWTDFYNNTYGLKINAATTACNTKDGKKVNKILGVNNYTNSDGPATSEVVNQWGGMTQKSSKIYVTNSLDSDTAIGTAVAKKIDINFSYFYGETDAYVQLRIPKDVTINSIGSTLELDTSKTGYNYIESKTVKNADPNSGGVDQSVLSTTFDITTSGAILGVMTHNAHVDINSGNALENAGTASKPYPKCVAENSAVAMMYQAVPTPPTPPAPTYWTVSFNPNGGSTTPASQRVVNGGTANNPGTPGIKTDSYGQTCSFSGWDWNFSTAITSNKTINAVWSCPPKPSYTVNFYTYSGTTRSLFYTTTISYGDTVSNPMSLPMVGGCTYFDGWYKNENFSGSQESFPYTITSNMTFYGRYLNQCHTVRFHVNGGTDVTTPVTVNPSAGGKVSEPSTTRANHVLKGWYTDPNYTNKWNFNTTVSTDMDLYAKWVPTHVVKYMVGPPYLSSESEYTRETVEHEQKATKLTTSKTIAGKTFAKQWTLNGRVYDFDTLVTGDITLYAVYTDNTYTLDFKMMGVGSAPATQSRKYNERFNAPNQPTDQNYYFRGWYTSSSLTETFNFNTPVTVSKSAYAKWEAKPYTVRFDAKEGSPTPTNQTVLYGSLATQPTSPRKALFTFVGWDTNENCSSNSKWNFNSDRVYGDMTLYACYADHAGYIDIKYVDENNEKINPMRTLVGEQDDTYTTEEAPRLYGYLLDETGNVAPGTRYTYKAQRQTITYHYTKRHIGMIQVEYRNWETKEILKDVEPDIITGFVDDTIVTQPKDIEGFVLVKSPEIEEFTFHEEFDKETDIAVYYYSRDPHGQGIIYVQYLDYETKEPIQPYDMYENTIGTTFIPINKHIEGYRLILTPPNDTYKYEIEPIVLKMYYKMYAGEVPKCKITVKYVSKDNYASVDTPQTFEGLCGDTFIPRPKELTGYTLIEGPKRPEYVYEVEERILYYVYEKKPAEPVPENPKTGVGTSIVTVTGVSGGLYALYWVLKKKSLFSRI